MAKVNKKSVRKTRPALTPEAREQQLMSLAIDLAEEQMKEGTASSQIITHFLKIASTKEQVEKEILEKKKELIEAQTQNLQSAKRVEELYEKALAAMKSYGGHGDPQED